MGNRYIFNSHIAPVTAKARDEKGQILFTKVFLPERIDGTTGRVASTGYTTLTDEEYGRLCNGSRTFRKYKDDLKLLSVKDDVPPDAKAPHEALADARREARDAKAKAVALEGEIKALKARVLEAEDNYKKLVSASTDDEKLKSLNDKIAVLEAENKKLTALHELSKTLVTTVGTAMKLEDAVKAVQYFAEESVKVSNAKRDFE